LVFGGFSLGVWFGGGFFFGWGWGGGGWFWLVLGFGVCFGFGFWGVLGFFLGFFLLFWGFFFFFFFFVSHLERIVWCFSFTTAVFFFDPCSPLSAFTFSFPRQSFAPLCSPVDERPWSLLASAISGILHTLPRLHLFIAYLISTPIKRKVSWLFIPADAHLVNVFSFSSIDAVGDFLNAPLFSICQLGSRSLLFDCLVLVTMRLILF